MNLRLSVRKMCFFLLGKNVLCNRYSRSEADGFFFQNNIVLEGAYKLILQISKTQVKSIKKLV